MFTSLRWRLLVLPLLLSFLSALLPSPLSPLLPSTLRAQTPAPPAPNFRAVGEAPPSAAQPANGIALIETPTATPLGAAGLSHPVKLPPARKNHAPALSINYNNDHLHGWLGRGWDLGLPTIDVETRWGVPRFSADDETETYLLEGEMLAPVAHRGETRPREADLTFYPRVEREFQRITRHGNSPENYWWEIRSPNGMTEFYGGTEDGLRPSALLTDANGNISSWALVRATDRYGNRIDYHYQNQADNGRAGSNETGKNRYPDRITYNGFNDEEGSYEIDFIRDRELGENRRPDVRIDFTSGFKQVTADLLRRIDVRYRGSLVRHYELDYKTGAFHQTLLTAITEFGSDGSRLAGHDFDYYELPTGDFTAFGPTENWSAGDDNVQASILNPIPGFTGEISALGGSASTSIQGGSAVTIGPIGPPASKELTVGGTFGAGSSEGKGVLTMVDINGDLLPDKVFRKDNALVWRKNLVGEGTAGFGPVRPVNGITEFSVVSTTEINLGFEANITPFFAGYENTTSRTSTTTYFSDFNGDDLIDILHRGRIYFNHLNDSGDPTFTLNSGDTPSPIVSGAEPAGDLVSVDPDEQQALIDMTPKHDVVRSWEAPFAGTVRITGDLRLVAQDGIDEYTREDGVRATIETASVSVLNTQLFEATIPANDYAPRTPTGVDAISVRAGQRIYFRLQSVFDGAFDRVSWDPEITYVGEDLTETDVNGLPVYRYRASEDFLLASCQTVVMPLDGRLDLTGTFSKPVLSDTLRLELLLGGVAINSWAFAPDSVVTDLPIENLNFPVGQDQLLQVRMRANASVDWTQPTWMPVLNYISADDGTPVVSPEGESLYRYCPAIDYTMRTKLLQQPRVWRPTADDYVSRFQLNYVALNFGVRMERLTLAVRSKDTTYLQRDTMLVLGAVAGAVDWLDTIAFRPGDSVWVEVFGPADLANALNTSTYNLTSNGTAVPVTIGKHRARTPDEMIFGPQFRGWGQFVYRGAGGAGTLPIQEALLALPNPDVDEEDIEDIEIDPDDPDFTEFEGLTDDPTQEQFIVMVAEPKDGLWRGYDDLTLVGRNFQSSSRLGEDDVILTPDLGTGGGAPPLSSISKMNAVAAGAGFGPASLAGSAAWNTTTNLLEVMDLNGDRYPDLVTPERAQYTTVYGGLSNRSITHGFGNHVAKSHAIGGTAGGKYVDSSPTNSGDTSGKGSRKRHRRSKTTTKNQGAKAQSANESAEAGGSISVNFSVDNDYTVHTWLDVNGDGLTDKVWDNGDVAFNRGYSFGPRENWGFADIRKGISIDYGGGGGVNISNNSFAAGFAITRTDNYSTAALQDMNGDGLADALSYNPDNQMLRVALNTGTGFANYINWARLSEPFDKGDATAESLNFAFTVCIPIFFIRICINPSGSTGRGASRVLSQFNDIDGDGFLDELGSSVDNQLTVRRSTFGKANLLKSIQRPLGATIALNYKPAGNNYGMPFPKWLLSEIAVNDGIAGDGPDWRKTRIVYEDPVYDRHEREFYGFAKTLEEQLDTENGDAVYRRLVSEYTNDSFYNRSLLTKSYTEDATGNRYRETEFTYDIQHPVTQTSLPPNLLVSDQGRAFPNLLQRVERYYEGVPTAEVEQRTSFTYDTLGQLLIKTEFGDGSPEDELRTEYEYYPSPAGTYFTDRVKTLEIYSGGALARRSEMTVDDQGNNLRIRQYLDEQTAAIYDYTYDDYGNVLTYQKPPNAAGERMTYTYVIDSSEHMYPVRTEDSYGYVSTAGYDFRYGQTLITTDINGHTVENQLDAHGRLAEMKWPKDSLYSYRFTYFPEANPPYARTDHYNPDTDSDVPTVVFLDGMGRVIQEQHLSVVNGSGRMVASGNVTYDAFDRPVTESYPGLSSIAPLALYSAPASAPRSRSEFDVLDRPVRLTLPDNSTSSMTYGFATGPLGNTLFRHQMTDALGFNETTLTDERGRREAFVREADTLSIQTLFKYNPLGELLSVTDHGGFRTTHEYDLLGRRFATTSADAGRIEMVFDLADNLLRKHTPNLREIFGEDGAITYSYDYERLTGIVYPINFQNKVEISYGGPEARFNRVGRVVLRQDASGGEEYFYDEHGELRKTIRTLLINESTARTFVSAVEYDSWGREKRLGYPDGEWVTYGYGPGGQLATMRGEKDGNTYEYIKAITYDEFDRMTGKTLGNDSREEMNFDPLTQRPQSLKVSASGATLQDLRLHYDVVGNLESREQAATGAEGIGGTHREQFVYDPLHRLTEATGDFSLAGSEESYAYFADHDGLYNQTRRELQRTVNGEPDRLNSFDQSLIADAGHPHQIAELGGRTYTYDANGNLLGYQGEAGSYRYQQSRWDEENRLMEFSDNGTISRYSYAADGGRAIQSEGAMKGVFTDGAPAGFISHSGNYVAYVSPYFTFTDRTFTKHYFIGDQRILTKEGTGEFNNSYWPYGGLTAGDLNYTERMNDLTQTVWNYYVGLGLPPGPPTLPGYYGQPGVTGDPLPTSAGGDFSSAPGLGQSGPNGEPIADGPPGSPTWYVSPPGRDSIGIGYGYEGYGVFPEVVTSFYHTDQLGNVTWITDGLGVAAAFRAYLPSGELLTEQTKAPPPLNYTFNGKEKDPASGLHFFGARYLEAESGRWLSIDPLADAYPGHNPYAFGLHNPLRFVDPDGREAYDLFTSRLGAAVDFARIYNKRSIQRNWEFGTNIYKTKLNGRTAYFYDRPRTDRANSSVGLPAVLGSDKIVADIHTHSRMEQGADGYLEHSDADIDGNKRAKRSGYVATPNGELQLYSIRTGEEKTVASGLPYDKHFYKAGDPSQYPEKNWRNKKIGQLGGEGSSEHTAAQAWRNRRGFKTFKYAVGDGPRKKRKPRGGAKKAVRKQANL